MGQGRFGHDRILSGVIVCHVVGNNGVFPERGSRGPCVGFWVPGSIWQRMWYFCAKFLWIKGVFYHGLCVIIYADDCMMHDKTHLLSTGTLHKSTTFFAILNQAPKTQHMGHESLVLETPHCSQPRDTRSHPTKSDHGRIGPAPLTNQNRFSATNENRGFPTNQVTGFRTN